MRSGEAQSVVQVFKLLSKFEMGLFEFYRKAMDYWVLDGEFLVDFIQEEVLHAENLSQMAELVTKNPEKFERGRIVDTNSVTAAISGLRTHLARLGREELGKSEILSVSREMENWVITFRYTELLRSNDPAYQKLVKEVAVQTEAHKRVLDKKVEELRRPKPSQSKASHPIATTIRVMVAE